MLLEKNSFSSGSTGQSGGFIRVYHNDPYLTEIAKEGINDFFSISEAVKFKQTGMLYIENETQHIKMEKQIGELEKSKHKISILSPEVLKKEFKFINFPKNSCVAYEEQAGYISPSLATNTWIETSRTKGALACEGIEVKEILMDNNCVVGVKTSYGTIHCKHVIVAAGAWSGNILDTIGIKIPVRSKIIQINFFDGIGQKDEDSDKKKDDDLEKKEDPATKENPNEKTELSEEQRSAISASIAAALSTKGHRANKETEIRSVFANYIVGNIDEKEARALGLVTGNGSVTIPDFLSKEIITYAQEEN
ncbi:NAD(P)/FAD-dependent oxidoreductase, partial [Bacillus sp. SS-TM]